MKKYLALVISMSWLVFIMWIGFFIGHEIDVVNRWYALPYMITMGMIGYIGAILIIEKADFKEKK